jgi:Tfp pilus assembly protein PilF
VDPEANEAYLKGRYLVNQFNPAALKQALAYFRQATEKAPAYAPAYAALGHVYFLFAQPFAGTIDMQPRAALEQSKAAAETAVAIDPDLAEARAVLGIARWLYDWNWQGAEEEFTHAIGSNPNSVDAHNYFAIFLEPSGRHVRAMSELARAIDLDPLNLRLRMLRGELLCYAGEYDEAIRQADEVLSLDPDRLRSHLILAWAHERKGQGAPAVDEYVKFITGMGLSQEGAEALRQAFERRGLVGFLPAVAADCRGDAEEEIRPAEHHC